MLENKSFLHIERHGRDYDFYLSSESPLGEVFDVLTDMRAFVLEKIISAHQEQSGENKNEEELDS